MDTDGASPRVIAVAIAIGDLLFALTRTSDAYQPQEHDHADAHAAAAHQPMSPP